MAGKPPQSSVQSAPPESGWLRAVNADARNPAEHPLPPAESFDCPTGTCDSRSCNAIARNSGETIAPFGNPHRARNECNRCPTSPPFQIALQREKRQRGPTRYSPPMDSEGNIWGADNSVTSANFHGDPGIWNSAQASGTFRVKTTTGGKRGGWQCRYYEGVLDDTSFDLGTYDYADAPSFLRAVGRFTAGSYVDNLHDDMDVQPHHANPYYIPNLTEKF